MGARTLKLDDDYAKLQADVFRSKALREMGSPASNWHTQGDPKTSDAEWIKMKAALLEDGTLKIQDVPTPVPGFEEALIKISAAGVCHSDLHLVRGDWAGVPTSGVVGHEAIGIVSALGPGAERYSAVGDRVILGLGGTGGGFWCGACEYCMKGQPRHCDQTKGIMGTFAEELVF